MPRSPSGLVARDKDGAPASSNREPQRVAPSPVNLPLPEEASASPEVRALFQQYRERFGRAELPGIVRCFATNASLLSGMLEIAEGLLFTEGELTRRQKEMLATFLSLENACPYCAASHGHLLREQGGSDDLLCALRDRQMEAPVFTEAERALLRFAAKVNADSQSITRADIETAQQTGWSEAQLSEAVHVTALFAAFNRIANAFGLPSPYPDLV